MTSTRCRDLIDRYLRHDGFLWYLTVPEADWPDTQAALEAAGADWLAFPVREGGNIPVHNTADGTDLLLLAQGVHAVATRSPGCKALLTRARLTADIMSAFLRCRLGPVSVSPAWSEVDGVNQQ
jgi:hypothetical protein